MTAHVCIVPSNLSRLRCPVHRSLCVMHYQSDTSSRASVCFVCCRGCHQVLTWCITTTSGRRSFPGHAIAERWMRFTVCKSPTCKCGPHTRPFWLVNRCHHCRKVYAISVSLADTAASEQTPVCEKDAALGIPQQQQPERQYVFEDDCTTPHDGLLLPRSHAI